MKRLFSLFSLCCLLFFSRSYAQVNPQNGAAQISIPLYSYTDPGNRLGLNANLVYLDGNGLKVSEMASAVGTGWNLDCGGMIARVQHGEPDDQKMDNPPSPTPGTDYSNYANTFYPDGYLYSTYSPSQVVDDGGGFSPYIYYLPLGVQNGYKPYPQYLADLDQDTYVFTFNGKSGQFVIGKNRQAVTLQDSKLQISFQDQDMTASNIRTRIYQFTITDESGIQYVFQDLDLSNVINYYNDYFIGDVNENADLTSVPATTVGNLAYSTSGMNVVTAQPNGWYVVNRWYLSKIINPFTGKQITFTYTTYTENVNTDKMIDIGMTSTQFGSVNVFWESYMGQFKRLSSVTLSSEEQLNFIYSSSPRLDLPNENALSQLQVVYNGQTVYSWNFGFGYLVGIDSQVKGPNDSYSPTELQWSRLCLTSLQKTGQNNISEPPYSFTYNLGGDDNVSPDIVPPMFSVFQDNFGYYNAGRYSDQINEGFMTSFYSATLLRALTLDYNQSGYDKLPLSAVAKNGIIQSITYPLGGSLTYTYEPNISAQMQLGGVRVKTTTQYDGVSHAIDIIKQYNYVNADESTSSGWGGDTYTFTVPQTTMAVNCSISQQNEAFPSVIAKDIGQNYLQNSIFSLDFGFTSVQAFSAATFASIESAVVEIIVGAIIEGIFTPSSETTLNYTEYLNVALTANNPLPQGYARTEVVEMVGSATNGKTVFEFWSPADYPISYPTLTVRYSNRPRYPSWVYGVPKTITVYDSSNNIIKQTIYNYTPIVNTMTDPNFLSKSWIPNTNVVGCALASSDANSDMINQETYEPFTGHMQLNNKQELMYDNAQQSNVIVTNFDYDNNNQLKDKYFNNSKGEKVQTFYYYPYSYPQATGALSVMNNGTSNIVNPVLSTETYINKSDGNAYLIGASAIQYNQVWNNDVKPSAVYSLQTTLPVVSSSLQPFNTANVVRDPNYYKLSASYSYDNNGNLVQSLENGNKLISSIYDYDGKLLVAAASNASYNDIGYSSFEAQGGKTGSWVNTAAIVSTDARTGNNSFNLSDPSNTGTNAYFGFGGLNSTLTYIVSFWSKNGTPCINGSKQSLAVSSVCQGGSGWKQGATVNGWTYNEIQLSNIDQVSASGSGLVDEFRVYPVGSQMTTTTYAPLVGKTSECDASNKVVYYQYDELGRLRYVMDDQKNIIKMYDYNYKQ